MRIASSPTLRIVAGLLMAVLLSVAGYQVFWWWNSNTPEALLKHADEMSWLNNWIAAEPIYRQAELEFTHRHRLSRALYARVSEMPAHSESSATVPAQIALMTNDLALPEAQDAETRLRILTILGMLEVNYDAGMARKTWEEVESLALDRHHYLLASRAVGEQGIAAFLLGDIATAKKKVVKAWTIAKFTDPGAHIRYASMFGTGLVEFQKYNEALGPLNDAIITANKTHGAAYPTIAITAKIEALSGIGKSQEALELAAEELKRVSALDLDGHLYELYQTRAEVYERMGRSDQAVSDYVQSAKYAKHLSYWRGLTQVDGLLAKAYLNEGSLPPALTAINEAIEANKNIPDELYFVPRDLAIKAEIMARLGDIKSSNLLYEQGADMLDALLSKAPTPTVERQLISDLDALFAGYFSSLCNQNRMADAFRAIERARGRVEAEGLSHHDVLVPHDPNPAERQLARLNLDLLNAEDSATRRKLLDALYETEQQLNPTSTEAEPAPRPIELGQLQADLKPSELFVEYVLDRSKSYALAITRENVHRYTLPPRDALENEATQYRAEILQQKTDMARAQQLFNELLGEIPEFREKQALIVVPDGKLHLLPFSTLADGSQYILASHLVSVAPSGTVLHILRHRENQIAKDDLPYVGVAAWTAKAPPTTLLANIRRAVSGPEEKELLPLPESLHEVEIIADDLPKPSTILVGASATETNFKRLPLSQYNVVHLALHGYVDPEFPDRSALVFAPQKQPTDDSLLQVREIRNLRLNANLVTLSACSTGVGPIGEEGVANIVNAFIEAGSQTVVSTLWELEDHASAHLMTVFYDHLSRHEEKAEALRQAQLEMLKSGSPPFAWAGFVLVGDPSGSLFPTVGNTQPSRRSQ